MLSGSGSRAVRTHGMSQRNVQTFKSQSTRHLSLKVSIIFFDMPSKKYHYSKNDNTDHEAYLSTFTIFLKKIQKRCFSNCSFSLIFFKLTHLKAPFFMELQHFWHKQLGKKSQLEEKTALKLKIMCETSFKKVTPSQNVLCPVSCGQGTT